MSPCILKNTKNGNKKACSANSARQAFVLIAVNCSFDALSYVVYGVACLGEFSRFKHYGAAVNQRADKKLASGDFPGAYVRQTLQKQRFHGGFKGQGFFGDCHNRSEMRVCKTEADVSDAAFHKLFLGIVLEDFSHLL